MYETQVEAGGARLDEWGPNDWFNLIDVDTLDMCSARNCVLGQLYGVVYIGIQAMNVDGSDVPTWQEMGFCSNMDGTHTQLEDAWRSYINTRRQVHE